MSSTKKIADNSRNDLSFKDSVVAPQKNKFRHLKVHQLNGMNVVSYPDLISLVYQKMDTSDRKQVIREINNHCIFVDRTRKNNPNYIVDRIQVEHVDRQGALVRLTRLGGRYVGGMIVMLRILRALFSGLRHNEDWIISFPRYKMLESHFIAKCKELNVLQCNDTDKYAELTIGHDGNNAGMAAQRKRNGNYDVYTSNEESNNSEGVSESVSESDSEASLSETSSGDVVLRCAKKRTKGTLPAKRKKRRGGPAFEEDSSASSSSSSEEPAKKKKKNDQQAEVKSSSDKKGAPEQEPLTFAEAVLHASASASPTEFDRLCDKCEKELVRVQKQAGMAIADLKKFKANNNYETNAFADPTNANLMKACNIFKNSLRFNVPRELCEPEAPPPPPPPPPSSSLPVGAPKPPLPQISPKPPTQAEAALAARQAAMLMKQRIMQSNAQADSAISHNLF